MKINSSRHQLAQLSSLVCMLLIFWLTQTVYQRFEREALSGIHLTTTTDVNSGFKIDLPTQWVGAIGHDEQKQFVFSFYYTDLNKHAQYLYIPRYEQRLTINLNGVDIHSSAINKNWAGPLSFNAAVIAIPDNILVAEQNTLLLNLTTGPLPAGSLSRIYIGNWETISDIYNFRQFFESELKWINYGLFLMLFIISLIFAFTVKSGRIFTALAIAIACLLLSRIGILAQPLPQVVSLVPYFVLLSPIGGMAYLAFSIELGGKNGSKSLLVGVFFSAMAFILLWFTQLNIREVALLVAAPILITSVMAASAFIIIHSLRKPHAETTLLFSGSIVYVYAVSHDVLARLAVIDSTFMLSPISSIFIVLGLIIFLMRRQAAISKSLEQSKDVLAMRLKQKERELQQAFDEKEVLSKRAATEEERHRITAELHDGVAGDLSTIIALTEMNTQESQSIRDMAKLALAELRMIIDTFSSDNSGLAIALASFKERCSKTLSPMGISFDWIMNDLPDTATLTPQHILNILRILQEAVTNAIKHGHPQKIAIAFAGRNNKIIITVDNTGGRSFHNEGNGYGIGNMTQRAQKLPDGDLSIKATKDGTRIELSFNLSDR